MNLEIIRDAARFHAVAAPWESLWRRSPGATPFQHPGWQLSWWRAFGPGELRAVAAWSGDRLVGLATGYLAEDGIVRPVGVSVSDYLDVLADPAVEAAPRLLAEGIASVLAAGARLWEMPELPPGAVALSIPWTAGGEQHPCETAPVLVLPAEASAIGRIVPARKARKLRMAQHRADRAGGWTIEDRSGSGTADAFAELVRLHTARWRERGEGGILADQRLHALHRDSFAPLHAAGLLRVFVCRIGGAVAGVYHGFRDATRAYAYLGGFDPAFAAASPGTLLLGHAIDDALAGGAYEFHFLRGSEPYKYDWGAKDRFNLRRVLSAEAGGAA